MKVIFDTEGFQLSKISHNEAITYCMFLLVTLDAYLLKFENFDIFG